MKRRLTLSGLVVAGALTAVLGAQQTPAVSAIQIDRVKDNLYVLRGAGGNTAAFITAGGIVLVDTKLPGWGRPLLQALKGISNKPVTTIINTHTHFDHVSGNVEFPANVDVVAHETTAALMREMRQPTGTYAPQRNVFRETDGHALAARTFTDRMVMGTGDDRIELRYFGRAHTGGDAFVIFPALRAMHAGDVFPNKGIPIIDINNGGSGVEYVETLTKATLFEDIDTVITGHHPTTLTLADMRMYRDFNRDFVDMIRAAKHAGRTIDDVARTWTVPERFLAAGYIQPPPGSSGQGTERLRMNIEIIWREVQ
jgi:cyclase